MIILIGVIIVLGSVLGGFAWGGGHLVVLLHFNELLIIGGAAFGALVIMSPRKVLIDMAKGILTCLKGVPHNKDATRNCSKSSTNCSSSDAATE